MIATITCSQPKPRPRAAKLCIAVAVLALLSPIAGFIVGLIAFAPGPGLAPLIFMGFGAVVTGVLGIIGSLICLFCGTPLYPDAEVRRPWLLPTLLNYPIGLLGFVGGLYWLALERVINFGGS